MDLKTVLLI